MRLLQVFVVLALCASLILAAGQGGTQSAGNQQTTPKVDRIDSTQAQMMQQQWEREREQLRQELSQVPKQERERVQVQQEARIALRIFAGNDSCDNALCQIGQQYQSSLQRMNQSEQRIRERSAFVRFFAGADDRALMVMQQEHEQNQYRLQQMNQFMQDCLCDNQTRLQLQEQIRALEQEQDRVNQFVEERQGWRGLFGWIWK